MTEAAIPRVPLRYLLPNGVTGLSIILAMAAAGAAGRGAWEWAAWLVVWCALLDRVDGAVARLTRTTSEFGVQFDTLADFMAFCVAPALLVYFLLTADARYAPHYAGPPARALLLGSVGVYVLFGAVRLARFNVQTAAIGPAWSRGLPVTIAGALVATFVLTAWELDRPGAVAAAPLVLVVLAGFMVSNLWLPKSLGPRTRAVLPLQALGVVAIYALGFSRRLPAVLLLAALAYPVIGFVAGAMRPPGSAKEGEAP